MKIQNCPPKIIKSLQKLRVGPNQTFYKKGYEMLSHKTVIIMYLLRVVKKLTSVLIAGFKKFNKNHSNKPTLLNHVEMNQL